ncbi:hypothetical protein D3C79_847570 [compost metagenome]
MDDLFELLLKLTLATRQFEDYSKIWDFGFAGYKNKEYSLSMPPSSKRPVALFGFMGKGKDLSKAIEEAINGGEQGYTN